MKSQDILLLLKLFSLAKQGERENVDSAPFAPDWRDWRDTGELESAPSDLPAATRAAPYSIRALAEQTGIGKSEVANALNRCYRCGLAKPARDATLPTVNVSGLLEFLVHGIRYVFPVRLGPLTRGIATGLTAPIFGGELRAADGQPPVWPDPKGNTAGLTVQPLFKTVPQAVRKDADLYVLLALVDSIRLGLPREKNLAITKLETLMKA
jgi:hypothetical protein